VLIYNHVFRKHRVNKQGQFKDSKKPKGI